MLEEQTSPASVYMIAVETGRDANGTYYAIAKDVPGLGAWGHSAEEARENLAQGAVMYLRSCFEHGDPLPKGIHRRSLPTEPVASTYEHADGCEQLIFSA